MSTPLVEHIMAATPPADLLRSVAARIRDLADAATPGTWTEMHLGSEGCIVHNDGKLRDRRRIARFGSKEWKADHADAEYVAAMQPAMARAVADMLDVAASYNPDAGDSWDVARSALAVARTFLDASGWRTVQDMAAAGTARTEQER